MHHLFLDHELYHALGHAFVQLGGVLRAHLLQNGNLEALGHGAVLLLPEDGDHSLQYLQVHLVWLTVRDVLDSLGRAHDHREKGTQRVLQSMIVHVQHVHDEVHALLLGDFENVDRDDLLHKVSPLFWRNLEGVDSKTEQHLRQALLGLGFFLHGAQELILVVLEYLLRDQQVRLVLVILQLEEQNLVVLAELDLVVVNALAELVG